MDDTLSGQEQCAPKTLSILSENGNLGIEDSCKSNGSSCQLSKAQKKAEKKRRKRAAFRKSLFDKQNGECHWAKYGKCRYKGEVKMDLEFSTIVTIYGNVRQNGKFASFEHLKPRSRGGRFNKENIVLAHQLCNRKRGSPIYRPDLE